MSKRIIDLIKEHTDEIVDFMSDRSKDLIIQLEERTLDSITVKEIYNKKDSKGNKGFIPDPCKHI